MKLTEAIEIFKNEDTCFLCDAFLEFKNKWRGASKTRCRKNAERFIVDTNNFVFSVSIESSVLFSPEYAVYCTPAAQRQIRILFMEWAISKGAVTIEDLFNPIF